MTHRIPVVAPLLILGALVLVTSCGFFRDAGMQTAEQRSIAGVTAVRLLTGGDLTVTVGSPEALTVTAGANQLVGLTSQVIDGTLVLDNKSNDYPDEKIAYALVVPPLRAVELSGSGSADGVGVLTGDAEVTVTGSGNASLSGLELAGLTVDLTGSGNVELTGRTTSQLVTVTGSGNYLAAGLTSEQADVRASGSGDVDVTVTARLSATASGSGSITFAGNPSQVEKTSTGSGEIAPG